MGREPTPAAFFEGFPLGLEIFQEVERAVAGIGVATVRVSRSQIAFRRRLTFALVWRPGQYVRNDVPAVLSIALAREVASPRIKAVAHPSPRVWMHHLELSHPRDVDHQVRAWLLEAYDLAG